jgi:hypothetical protein
MDPTQSLVAFDLRLRALELPVDPADTADFHRPLAGPLAATDDLVGDGLDRLLLESAALAEGLLPLASAPEARMIPLFDADVRPIPIPTPELVAETTAPPAPQTAAWALTERRDVLVAAVPRRAAPGRTIVVAAVSLPLLLLAAPASASEPAVQRPATAEPAAAPAPEVEPPLEPMPAPQPEPLAQPPQPEAPPQPETPESFDQGATPGATGVSEAHWQAMRGEEVKLMLPQGPRQGRLVAVDGPEVVFVDYEGDGRLYSVPKVQVMELRGVVKQGGYGAGRERPYGVPDPTLPTGNGLIAGGSVATAIGVPFFLSAAVITGVCPSCISVTLPLFIPGIAGLAAGIPMLVRGVRRRRAWRESAITSRLRPSFANSRQGWTGSLTFRF